MLHSEIPQSAYLIHYITGNNYSSISTNHEGHSSSSGDDSRCSRGCSSKRSEVDMKVEIAVIAAHTAVTIAAVAVVLFAVVTFLPVGADFAMVIVCWHQ